MVAEKKLFGRRLKSLRENKGWTQENLAERMDISSNYLSSIERGQENPTLDMLIKISGALKVEMWELFDFGHEASPDKLREMLSKFTNELDEEKLKLAVKIIRAIAE